MCKTQIGDEPLINVYPQISLLSVPQIYQILKSAFNSQIYVLFEILKSESKSQTHECFSNRLPMTPIAYASNEVTSVGCLKHNGKAT